MHKYSSLAQRVRIMSLTQISMANLDDAEKRKRYDRIE
jgi:hypothetical protein